MIDKNQNIEEGLLVQSEEDARIQQSKIAFRKIVDIKVRTKELVKAITEVNSQPELKHFTNDDIDILFGYLKSIEDEMKIAHRNYKKMVYGIINNYCPNRIHKIVGRFNHKKKE